MKITNLKNSPYQLVDANGEGVMLAAHGTIDIDPHPMHLGLYRQLGYFRIEEGDAPAPAPPKSPAPPKGREELRAKYEALTGEKPDGRWSAERLADEIGKAESN